MKSPKGFRGRYFSLAAILAFSATVTLANQTQSVVETKKEIQKQEELDDKEELTPSAEELDVVVVSKKIKTKESDATFASEIYTKAMIEKSKSKRYLRIFKYPNFSFYHPKYRKCLHSKDRYERIWYR